MDWYKKSIEKVLSELIVDPVMGLDEKEVKERLNTYGANELQEEGGTTFLSKLIGQFSDFLVLILIGAAIVSMIAGEPKDSIVIMAIVIANALLGVYQE